MKNLLKAAGKVIGEIRGEVLRKRVVGSKHQLRRPPAWALDAAALNEATASGCRRVEVFDKETGRTFSADVDTIRTRGFLINRGFGTQFVLPLQHWQMKEALL